LQEAETAGLQAESSWQKRIGSWQNDERITGK